MRKFRIEKCFQGPLYPVTSFEDFDSFEAAKEAFKETQNVLSPEGIYLVTLEDIMLDTDDEGNPYIRRIDVLRVDSKI